MYSHADLERNLIWLPLYIRTLVCFLLIGFYPSFHSMTCAPTSLSLSGRQEPVVLPGLTSDVIYVTQCTSLSLECGSSM